MLKITGILALTIYLMMIGLLLYYFNHHTDKKNIHFVKKNSERVVVSLSGSKSRSKSNSQVKKSKNSKKKKSLKDKKPIKKKKRVKKSKNIKKKKVSKSSKSTQKEKKTKKTKISKKNQKPKKINSLFDNIDDKKLIDSNKKKEDRGVENAYFAKIQDILQGWNAQSDFAGESATIWVKINRDGSFKFKLLRPSNNLEFNNGLIEYIKQLQKIGFDPHKNSKSYELEVEFVAKE